MDNVFISLDRHQLRYLHSEGCICTVFACTMKKNVLLNSGTFNFVLLLTISFNNAIIKYLLHFIFSRIGQNHIHSHPSPRSQRHYQNKHHQHHPHSNLRLYTIMHRLCLKSANMQASLLLKLLIFFTNVMLEPGFQNYKLHFCFISASTPSMPSPSFICQLPCHQTKT